MLYGIYLSAQGAELQSTRNDVVANNLANASTTAFKRDIPVVQANQPFDVRFGANLRDAAQRNRSTGGISLDRVVTDFRPGAHERTDRPLDVALAGRGFLRVQAGEQELLTRNGRLARNDLGELVTEDSSLPVLSTAGDPIQIPSNVTRVAIGPDGELAGFDAADRVIIRNRIDLVDTDPNQLEKLGDSLYQALAPVEPATDPRLRQGFVEASGVNPVREMTQMLDASRCFEANINMIRMQDESLGNLLQAVGG